MLRYGYDPNKIKEGRDLYEEAERLYKKSKKESAESTQAYAKFTDKLEKVKATYSLDRKKAKAAFANRKEIYKQLAIEKVESRSYPVWIAETEQFYQNLHDDAELFNVIKEMDMTANHLTEMLRDISDVKSLYSAYTKEKGESQDAVKLKDKAFKDLSEWTRACYTVAKIALHDRKQLLEASQSSLKASDRQNKQISRVVMSKTLLSDKIPFPAKGIFRKTIIKQ